jgi:hypothetical protein
MEDGLKLRRQVLECGAERRFLGHDLPRHGSSQPHVRKAELSFRTPKRWRDLASAVR